MSTRHVTEKQAQRCKAALVKQLGSDAERAKIIPDWDWSSGPVDFAIVWEEGPFEWAHMFPRGGRDEEFGFTVKDVSNATPNVVYIEPITSWAVGLYRED